MTLALLALAGVLAYPVLRFVFAIGRETYRIRRDDPR